MRLSPVAKGAFVVALIGCGIAVYGRQTDTTWASAAGSVMLFGGAIVYLIERARAITRRSRQSSASTSAPPDDAEG